ncbi:hypothetical protein ABEB36_006993 [Hypothenemus hampei]|uniref:Zinc carboxypeptidase A 1 n=1 Tax=Hypothenemus hampei TaxID=57062 RepID=A0ABD1ESE0_HYPHA
MIQFRNLLRVLVFWATLIVINCTSYNNYAIYKVIPETKNQLEFLKSLHEKFDFWKESRQIGLPSDVMVAPQDQQEFENMLNRNNLQYEVVINNVETIIQKQKVETLLTRSSLGLGDVTFNSFMYYSEQMAYVRRVAEDYPDKASVETIGQSYEGTDILLLKISSGPSETSTPKPMIFIDAGIHCREWIAPPVALYIIQQLVENTTNAALIENVDWAIAPNVNPDGYSYTQTTNRLWRKNRRLAEGDACYGIDLNRNFGYMWMFDGASNYSCDQTYAGPSSFSEPESRAIRDWILPNKDNIKLYLTFHSYGEMILYPWGYAPIYTENADDLQRVGELAAEAIESSSTINSNYTVANSAIFLYPAAGASDDWAVGEAEIKLSYTVELPNGDAPYYFMIPARQILPVVQETFQGVQAFHKYIEEEFWTTNSASRMRKFIN